MATKPKPVGIQSGLARLNQVVNSLIRFGSGLSKTRTLNFGFGPRLDSYARNPISDPNYFSILIYIYIYILYIFYQLSPTSY